MSQALDLIGALMRGHCVQQDDPNMDAETRQILGALVSAGELVCSTRGKERWWHCPDDVRDRLRAGWAGWGR